NEIRTVGVVGAGQMGNGMAHVCALAGYDVMLNDIDEARIAQAIHTIEHNMHRQVGRGMIDEKEMNEALPRIRKAAKMDELGDCDLAIESAVEDEEIKRKIFADLRPILRPDA